MYNKNKSTIDVIDNLFLPSLINNASLDSEIIIIDDASPLKEETEALINKYSSQLKKKFRRFVFKRNSSNLGFGGSFNEGARLARGKKLFMVNDDIYLPKGSISALVDTLYENKKYGIVGPIVNEKDVWTYQYCKQAPKITSYSKEELRKIEDFAKFAKKLMSGKRIEDYMVSGFCFVIDTLVFNEMGGFQKVYKNGSFEDIDLCRRIGKKYLIIINPEIFVYHGGLHGAHVSLNQQRLKRHYNEFKNTLKFASRWGYFFTIRHVFRGIYRAKTGRGTVSELFEKEKFK
jgi:hypothetical protein